MRPAALLVLLLAIPLAIASADTWMRYDVQRHDSPDGRHAALVDGRGLFYCGTVPAPMILLRRAEGAPPPAADRADDPEALVDEHDIVVASFLSPQIPLRTFVLDDGRVVIVDSYGGMGHADLVRVHAADGGLLHALGPEDVFGPDFGETFGSTASSVRWEDDTWVDAVHDRLVLLGTGARLRVVALARGEVPDVPPGDVLLPRVSSDASDHARAVALQAAVELDVPRLAEFSRPLVADGAAPLSVRIRAATALARAGEPASLPLVAAALEDAHFDAASWAWMHLPELVGERAALPLLLDAARGVRDVSYEVRAIAVLTLAGLGDPARTALVAAQLDAAERHADEELVGLVSALDGVEFGAAETCRRLMEEAPGWVDLQSGRPIDWDEANAGDFQALVALVQRDETSELHRLLTWRPQRHYPPMDHRTSPLALATLAHLQQHPIPEAGEALVRFLEQTQQHEHATTGWTDLLTVQTRAALAALVGEDHGTDASNWRAALAQAALRRDGSSPIHETR